MESFEAALIELREQQRQQQKLCGDAYNKDYLKYVLRDRMGNRIIPAINATANTYTHFDFSKIIQATEAIMGNYPAQIEQKQEECSFIKNKKKTYPTTK